ncbi:hypothetical protein GMORB2_5289 [Geosmithia morbida]|uniref:Myb-like domain-containing protein n=1 Tax=Geosmithia morbida TaxID=1094350 RepID=A0A9P5D248_9HYPO|nr:uncharacterized protein GMORB2_5289 [Geosmithia morbida]KAF4124623.1 hypothetical protein GMORB2_5289 [Geosmithia morbida]
MEYAARRGAPSAPSLPDLSRASDGLATQLQSDRRSAVFARLLSVRRDTFLTVRREYEHPAGYPFIDYSWLDDGQRDLVVLAKANLVSVLDTIERIRAHQVSRRELVDRLAELDGFMGELFRPYGANANSLDLSLEVRTAHAIEALATAVSPSSSSPSPSSSSSRKKMTLALANPVLVSIFCEDAPSTAGRKPDYAAILSNGEYFKPLGHRSGELVEDACYGRIGRICSTIRASKEASLDRLRDMFPLSNTLDRLWDWILGVYANGYVGGAGPAAGDDDFQDAMSQPAEGSTQSAVESLDLEPIERDTVNAHRSLFTGIESLVALRTSKPSGSPRPPMPRSPPGGYHADDDDDDDDDDDTPTENPERQQQTSRMRSRVEATRHAIGKHRNRKGSHPNPSPPPATGLSSSSSLSSSNRLMAAAVKAAASARRRHAWSDADARLLVHLIDKRKAVWSVIEFRDGHRFTPARKQQAIRDKARNLKVDYLITDRVLPRSFDKISLSKKEVARVLRYGRNPFRLESDITPDEYCQEFDK